MKFNSTSIRNRFSEPIAEATESDSSDDASLDQEDETELAVPFDNEPLKEQPELINEKESDQGWYSDSGLVLPERFS